MYHVIVTLVTSDKQWNGCRATVESKSNRSCNHRMMSGMYAVDESNTISALKLPWDFWQFPLIDTTADRQPGLTFDICGYHIATEASSTISDRCLINLYTQ